MLPVLFQIVIPAGVGKAVAAGIALLVVVLRAVSYVRRARREGAKASVVDALRADTWTIALFAGALAVLWRAGVLDGEIRLPVHTYGLLIALGIIAGVWLARREARRSGQDPDRISDLSTWLVIAGLAGSQIFYAFVNFDEYFGPDWMTATPFGRLPRLLVVWKTGVVFYGGFIGAAIAGFVYMRRHRMPFLEHADTLIPSLAFGHFLGRLGCFSAGCCWGEVAGRQLPFLVRFPPASLAYQTFASRPHPEQFLAPDRLTTLPLFPVQLYESFGELAIFAVLVWLVRPRKRFDGQVFATWLLLYAVLRTVVELFRGDIERGVYLGLGAGQWVSMAIFATGIAMWAWARRAGARPAPAA